MANEVEKDALSLLSVSGLCHEHWHIHNLDLHIEALPQKSLLVQVTGSNNFGFTQCQLGDMPH
jgi:hypothetical protein